MHFLLRVKKPELYEKIRSVLSNTKFIAEELPGTGFSIRASDYQEVFSILTRLGYSPKPFTGPKNGADKKAVNILETYLSGKGETAGSGEEEFLFPEESEEKIRPLRSNELVHVINYAILMEQGVEVEMKAGGTRVRLVPREIQLHLSEPRVTGVHPLNGDAVDVNLNEVDKIRVED